MLAVTISQEKNVGVKQELYRSLSWKVSLKIIIHFDVKLVQDTMPHDSF